MTSNYEYSGLPSSLSSKLTKKSSVHKDIPNASGTQNALALVCPCYVYGKAIGYLKAEESIDSTTCCIWSSILCAGIVGSSVSASYVSAAAGQQAGQALYALCCIGEYLPHFIYALPLSLEMRAYGTDRAAYFDANSIFKTICCPCCVLASVEKWAKENKGKVELEQGSSSCTCPPMKLIPTPLQMSP